VRPLADAHEFVTENVASQHKFGAGDALISVSLDRDRKRQIIIEKCDGVRNIYRAGAIA
jgi:hypothetical protein